MSGKAVVGRRTFGERFGMRRSRRESFIHCSEKDRKDHVNHAVLELAKLDADLRIGSGLAWSMAIFEHSACCTPFSETTEVVGGLCESLFLSYLGTKSKECKLSRLVGTDNNSWECCWFPQKAWSVESCCVPCIKATTPRRRAGEVF